MNTVEKVFILLANSQKSENYIEKQIGLAQGSFKNWRNEKSKPSADALLKIADYFNVSVDYLLGREDHKKMPDGFPSDINTFAKDMASVGFPVEEFNKLDVESQQKAIEYLKLVISGLANKNK